MRLRFLSLAFIWMNLGTVTAVHADEMDGMRSCIHGIGDVNQDGVPDLVIASRNGVLPELVWVLSGKDGSVIHMLEGARPGDGFGCTMDVCGDLDGDGVADVIVGAWGNYGERMIGGVLRSSRHSNAYSRVFSGKDGRQIFELYTGWCVGTAGDVNGGGTSDLLVGAPDYDYKEPATVCVHSGRDGSVLYWLHPPEHAKYASYFGTAFVGIGDIDQDGAADYAIGSSDMYGASGIGRGCIAVYSGGTGTMLMKVEGDRECTGLGWSLARAGDVDDDGVMDLVAGAVHRYARVLSGKDLHTIHNLPSREGYDMCDAFASSLDVVGDVDFDCVPDWVVGANEWVDAFSEGYAYLVSGRTGLVIRELFRSEEEGVDVCGAGDIDGDGVPDVALAIQSKWQPDPCLALYQTEHVNQTESVRVVSGRTGRTIWDVDLDALRARTPSLRMTK